MAELAAAHPPAATARVREFALAGTPFPFNSRPAIMGVVNLSPDSWYRESVCLTTDQAIRRGLVLAAQGADLVDLGAESTLGHAQRVSEADQSGKLIPVLRGLREEGVLVSVETYSLTVARRCLENGANVLNLTGREQSPELYRVVAEHGAAVILCYVQGKNVREVGDFSTAGDPIALLCDYFAREIERASALGVEKILIDPGLGFYYRNLQDSAARVQFQMKIFLNTFRLRALGFPVCHALPHAFEFFGEEVRSAEGLFAVLAALGKTDLFRTHEVPKTRAVLQTLSAYS